MYDSISTTTTTTMEIIEKATSFVVHYMSQFDASHDYHHVQRVLRLAQTIQAREQNLNPSRIYRSDLVTFGALLHDIGDKKYHHLLKTGQDQDGTVMVQQLLQELGADQMLATEVQTIVNHVSYSNEVRNPAGVAECLDRYPELGIVQDADRLDAIGAVGIGRCFAYTAAVGKNRLDDAIVHFQEKLEKLEGMMKTESGKRMAAVRTQRIHEFRGWWADEV